MTKLYYMRCECCSCLVIAYVEPSKLFCPQCIAAGCNQANTPTMKDIGAKAFRDEAPLPLRGVERKTSEA
jgi:hypothetical protein